jgi:GMP synthase-like glutamine amidotransferase
MSLNGKLILGYMPGGTGQIFPFNAVFNYGQNLMEKGFDNVDAIVLWGGTDICPSYYGQKPHPTNQQQHGPSVRDRNEWNAMKYARLKGIPIIGVCRGAQFLCVFSGGKLVQHVTGHNGGSHNIITADNQNLLMQTTSCHHQMMMPWKTDYRLLAWSSLRLSHTYEGETSADIVSDQTTKLEPEVVFFPKVRGLAIQGHPEWMQASDDFVIWCNKQVSTLLLDNRTRTVEDVSEELVDVT